MCAPNHNALLSYAGLKVPTPSPYFALSPAASQLSALDFHRSQFCDYRQLLGLRQYQALHASGLGPYAAAAYLDPYTQYLYKGDPRARFVQEEPKPSHSYIGLIAMAILSSKDKKLVLSDIYQWILDNYPYFRTRGPGWRNSIRHNLSLNDCFIKSGRSANGKGHYWAVHPANVDDFTRGDFRRRRAQRKVRKHMGLSVPDDDDDSPSPSPNPISWAHGTLDVGKDSTSHDDLDNNNIISSPDGDDRGPDATGGGARSGVSGGGLVVPGAGCLGGGGGMAGPEGLPGRSFLPLPGCGNGGVAHVSKKRLFDVESLLAPDYPVVVVPKVRVLASSSSSSSAVMSSSSPPPLSSSVRFPSHTSHSDKDSVTSDHRPACLSDDDDSDIDIEVEDVEDSCCPAGDVDQEERDLEMADVTSANLPTAHPLPSSHRQRDADEAEFSSEEGEGGDRERAEGEEGDLEAKPDGASSALCKDQDMEAGHASSTTATMTSTTKPASSAPPCSSPSCQGPETCSSALDLSSQSCSFSASPSPSSSAPSSLPSSLNSASCTSTLPATSTSPAQTQTLVLPRGMDAGQRARWMSLGLGLGGVGGMGPPSADLTLRRYSAFHAAGSGVGTPGLRTSLPPSFLHPVFAAARYPSFVPLTASAAQGVMGSDPSARARCDDASQGPSERV